MSLSEAHRTTALTLCRS